MTLYANSLWTLTTSMPTVLMAYARIANDCSRHLCKCHRGGKNHGPTGTRTQGLSLTVRALCQLSYRATWSSFDIFPCLIRFVPESARNNGGTTKHALFDARCPSRVPTLSHQMSQGRKKSWPDRDSNQGPPAIRETTELLSQWPTFDIFPQLIPRRHPN